MTSKKKTVAALLDRGFTLSQRQYDLIFEFLKNGVAPTPRDVRNAEMDGHFSLVNGGQHSSRKMGTLSQFKKVAKRLKYRVSDDSLVFYGNSKIVLPNTQFRDVIKKAHQGKGEKHWNFTKTLIKLSEKYSMGCRQFGISEEMVREVVRACKEGSCAKYHIAFPTKRKMTPKKLGTTKPKVTVEVPHQSQPARPPVYMGNQTGQSYVAVPCNIVMPGSMTQAPFSLAPVVLYTGSCSMQNQSKPATVVSQPRGTAVQSGPSANISRFVLMPTSVSSQTAGITHLLSTNTATRLTQVNTSVKPAPMMHLTGTVAPSVASCSSLTNFPETSASQLSLQSNDRMTVDDNNNVMKPKNDDDVIVIEPFSDDRPDVCESLEKQPSVADQCREVLQALAPGSGNSRSTSPLTHDAAVSEEPYHRMLGLIQTMRQDVLKSLAGSTMATDKLKRKMCSLELMVGELKRFTKENSGDLEIS